MGTNETSGATTETSRSDTAVAVIGLTVAALAGMVLVGWAIGSDRLVAPTLAADAMKPPTALTLALLGVAVALIGRRPDRTTPIAVACAVVAAAIGILTLSEYAFGWRSGFDTALFKAEVVAAGGAYPGRMSPITAVTVIIAGTSLGLRATRHTRLPHLGGLVIGTISTVVLTSYLYGAESLRRIGEVSGVALYTAVALLLIGIALVASTDQHGLPALARRGPGASLLVRGGVPAVALAPVIVGWLRMRGQDAGWYDTEYGVALMVVSAMVIGISVLWVSATAIARYEDGLEGARRDLARANTELEAEVERRTATLVATETVQRESLDALEEGIALFTPDLEVRLLNRAGQRMLGYSGEELGDLAQSASWVTYREDGSVLPVGERPIAITLASETPITGAIVRWRTKSGSSVLLRISTRPIHTTGELTSVVVAFADVTSERAAERARATHLTELAALNKALELAVATKDQFLASASHDLRNPITAIRGFADLLASRGPALSDAERTNAVAAISRQGRRLQALVDDLLTVAVIEGGTVTLRMEPVDVGALLRQIAEDAAIDSPVTIDVPPGTTAELDPHRVAQIVTNLLTNADRYGAPPLVLSAAPTNGIVSISLSDHGPGVPPEFVSRMFERFATTAAGGDIAQRGTGLGLAIALGLAEAHGGHLRYEPVSPHGSRFTVELPVVAEASRAPVQARPEEPAADPSDDGRGRKVLVVDDDADQLELLRLQLSRAGFHTILTADGREALRVAESSRPDLVIADLEMPGLDGFGFIEQVRSNPATSAIPIIVLTGRTDGSIAARALSAGANDFLRKPVEPVELMARLRGALAIATRTSDLATLTDNLDEATRTDALTGVLNRRGLEQEIERLSTFARRHGLPVSVLVTDVDNFKRINDLHSHAIGDRVLCAVADAIRARTRGEDIVGRWGGEEFVSLLPHTVGDGAALAGERLRAAVEAVEVITDDGHAICPTISVGAATVVDGDLQAALALADRRMYDAKAAGRNRVHAT